MLGQPEKSERGGIFTLFNLVFGPKKQGLPIEAPSTSEDPELFAGIDASIEKSMAKLSGAHAKRDNGAPTRRAPKDDHSVEYGEQDSDKPIPCALDEARSWSPNDYAHGLNKFRRIWKEASEKKPGALRSDKLFPEMIAETHVALVEMIKSSIQPPLVRGHLEYLGGNRFWRFNLMTLYGLFGDDGCTNSMLRKFKDMRQHCESAEEAIALLKDAQQQRRNGVLEGVSAPARRVEWDPSDVDMAIELAKRSNHLKENSIQERAMRPPRSDEMSPPPPRRRRQDSYGRSERERNSTMDNYRLSDRARDLVDHTHAPYDAYGPQDIDSIPLVDAWRPSEHERALDDSHWPSKTNVFHSPGRRAPYPVQGRRDSSPSFRRDETWHEGDKGTLPMRRPSPTRRASRERWQMPYGGSIPLEGPFLPRRTHIEWTTLPNGARVGSRKPLSRSAKQEEIPSPKRPPPEQRRSSTRDALPPSPQANRPGNGVGRQFYRNMSWTKPTSSSTTRDQPNAQAANPPYWPEAPGNDVPDRNPSTVPPTQPASARIDINGVKDVPTGPAQGHSLFPVAASVKVWPHIFIPSHSVPAKRATVQHLEKYLRKYAFKEICVDRSGYYVTFDCTSFGRKSLQTCGKECQGKKLFAQYVLEMRQFPDGQRAVADSLDSPTSPVNTGSSPPRKLPLSKNDSSILGRQRVAPEFLDSPRSPVETASSPPSKLPLMAPNRDEYSILGRQRAAPEFLDSPRSPVETASSPPSKLPLMAAGKGEFSILGRAAKANANVSSGPAISGGDQEPHRASDTAMPTSFHDLGRSDPRLPGPPFGRTLSRQDREDAASSISEPTVSDVSSASLKQCHICKKAKKTDILVRCTTCPRQYHNYCHNSAPSRVGSGWQCQRCIRKKVPLKDHGPQATKLAKPPDQPPGVQVISSDAIEHYGADMASKKPQVSPRGAVAQPTLQQPNDGTPVEKIWRALAQAGNKAFAEADGFGNKHTPMPDCERNNDFGKQGASDLVDQGAEQPEEQRASTQGHGTAPPENAREARVVLAQQDSSASARHAPALPAQKQATTPPTSRQGEDVMDIDRDSDPVASSAVAPIPGRPSGSELTAEDQDAASGGNRDAANISTQAKPTGAVKMPSAIELSGGPTVQEGPSIKPKFAGQEQTNPAIETTADSQRELNTIAPETTIFPQEPGEKAGLLGSALVKDTLATEADDLVERSFSASGPVGTPQSTAGDKKASKLKFVRKKIAPVAASPSDAQPADSTSADATGHEPPAQRSLQNDSAEIQKGHEAIEEIQQPKAGVPFTGNNDLEAANSAAETPHVPVGQPVGGASLTGIHDFERPSALEPRPHLLVEQPSRDTSESASHRPAKARRKQKTTVNCETCGKPTARRPGRPARCRQCNAADDANAAKPHISTIPDEASVQKADAAIATKLHVSPRLDKELVQESAEHMRPQDGAARLHPGPQSLQQEQSNEQDTAQESAIEAQNDTQSAPVASDQDCELEPSSQLLALMDGGRHDGQEVDSPQSSEHSGPDHRDEAQLQSEQPEHLHPAAEELIEAHVQEALPKVSRNAKRKDVEHERGASPPLKQRKSQRCDADAEDEHDLGNWSKRPKATYLRLIAMAIRNAPGRRLQLDDAVKWVSQNVPGYLGRAASGKWGPNLKSTIDLNAAGRSGPKICRRVQWRQGDGGSANRDWYELIPGLEDRLDRWNHQAKRPVLPRSAQTTKTPQLPQQMKQRIKKHVSFDVMDVDDSDQGDIADANNTAAESPDGQPLASRTRSAALILTSGKDSSTSYKADHAAADSSDEEPLSAFRSRSGSNAQTPSANKRSSLLQKAAESSDEEPLSASRRPSAALAPTSTQPSPTPQQAQAESGIDIDMTGDIRSYKDDAKTQESAITGTQLDNTFKPVASTGSEDDDLLNLICQEAAKYSETTKSFAEAWPEYSLSKPPVSSAEIRARPTRKQNFGKSPCYSRLGKIDPLHAQPFERDEPEARPESLHVEAPVSEVICSSVNELFGLRDLGNPIPIAHNGELAFTQPKSKTRSEKYCTGTKLRGKGDVVFKGKKMEVGVEY